MATVALVGFAPTNRDLAPWDNPEVEIWGCNEAYNFSFMKRWTRWFQLHPFESFSRDGNHNDQNHYAWLKEQKSVEDGGFPIYMQKCFADIPASVPFPLDEIQTKFGTDYFTSSFAYMIAMALYEGFTRIEIYGFEMKSESEYFHQRSNAEYWIGIARGMGVEIYLPPGANLLRGQKYAYEDNSIGFRQQLEFRRASLDIQKKEAEKNFYAMQGKFELFTDLINRKLVNQEVPEAHAYYNEINQQVQQKAALVNVLYGATEEVRIMTSIFDGHSGMKEASYASKDQTST